MTREIFKIFDFNCRSVCTTFLFILVEHFLACFEGEREKTVDGVSDNLSLPVSLFFFLLLQNISKRNKEKVFRLYRCFGRAKESVGEFDIICHFRRRTRRNEKKVEWKQKLKQTMNLNFWCFLCCLDAEMEKSIDSFMEECWKLVLKAYAK